MKRCGSTATFALAILTALGLASRAAAGEQVPFKGSLEGSFTVTVIDPDDPLTVAIQLDAFGEATQLGEFALDFPHVVDRSAMPPTGKGIYTLTAANGDKLFADVIGKATPIGPGLLYGVEKATITGGTGRFANAAGSFVVERLIDQMTLTTIGSFEGSISVPAAQ
jgi:hypothetical protein